MKQSQKFFIALAVCLAFGAGIGALASQYHKELAQWWPFKSALYASNDQKTLSLFSSQSPIDLQWSMLLPEQEKSVLEQFQQQQATTPTEFADNILLSLEASVNENYSAAMNSVNSVDDFDGKAVSIAGFIVPLDYHQDKTLNSIFLVPYFGACLHFPPPPPNQIIFSQLGEGFKDFELTQAYQLEGVLRRGLFEDPMGTSAYILDVVSIKPFYEDPDDFRQH